MPKITIDTDRNYFDPLEYPNTFKFTGLFETLAEQTVCTFAKEYTQKLTETAWIATNKHGNIVVYLAEEQLPWNTRIGNDNVFRTISLDEIINGYLEDCPPNGPPNDPNSYPGDRLSAFKAKLSAALKRLDELGVK